MKNKTSKWLKWKIGAVGLLGLVLLFHEVKSSAAFQQAYAHASPNKEQPTASTQDHQDGVMKEWRQNRQEGSSMDNSAPSSRKHRQSANAAPRNDASLNGGSGFGSSSGGTGSSSRSGDSSSGGSMNPGSSSTTTPNTRTGRS
ncbi:hypothetical protein [Paenibacillus rigui]|uniref:Uncharacterized protein n=1 Tax=Paenibacillus rigui TaxID=554312 RepID=A0A229USD0_9BACL|nr:hypothetical protein [Paenibacillus rigui]OXM86338.1 hypothetical protein CF651_10415 [Paenibacillus rigui]